MVISSTRLSPGIPVKEKVGRGGRGEPCVEVVCRGESGGRVLPIKRHLEGDFIHPHTGLVRVIHPTEPEYILHPVLNFHRYFIRLNGRRRAEGKRRIRRACTRTRDSPCVDEI